MTFLSLNAECWEGDGQVFVREIRFGLTGFDGHVCVTMFLHDHVCLLVLRSRLQRNGEMTACLVKLLGDPSLS